MKNYRFGTIILLISILFLVTNTKLWAEEKKREKKKEEEKKKVVPAAAKDVFEIRNIEGWTVYINKKDLKEHAEEMNKALDHLQNQFYQARLVTPGPAVAIMQERVPLWMEYDSGPGLSFHPSYKWLLDRGHPSPEGLRSLVSNCHAKDFCKTTLHQPWVVLHEMSHGYDYTYLGEGKRYGNTRIEEVYKRAKDKGHYEKVLCRYSKGAKHYAITNKMEYLAENTEAYFGTNDFYPFVRAELREHDPGACVLLEELWGVDVKEQQRKIQSLVNFIKSQSEKKTKAPAKKRRSFVPTSKYDKRQIEGWTVFVGPELIEQKAYGDEICKLLRNKLHMVKRYVPEKGLEELQKAAIWLERNNRAVPYMTYHASAEKLKADKQNPEKVGAIEVGNAARFMQWQDLQQFMVLNQLARAYYDRVLKENKEEIKKAWEKAEKSGKYDKVLRFDGKHVRHPALESPLEFFAEMTESYYGVNDHYPFLQFETRQHDEETCELLAKLWGGKAK